MCRCDFVCPQIPQTRNIEEVQCTQKYLYRGTPLLGTRGAPQPTTMTFALIQAINTSKYGADSPPKAAKRKPGAKPVAKPKQSSTTPTHKTQPEAVSAPNSTEKKQDRILYLRGPENLKSWTEQTKRMATREGFLDDLLPNQQLDTPGPSNGSYYSEDDWHRKMRKEHAHHLVISRITPALFAYMRVLGYNEMAGKDAADAFVFAQRAARRMPIAELCGGSCLPKQSVEEVERMMYEYLNMRKEQYPPCLNFGEAKEWLGRMLVLRAPTNADVMVMVNDTISLEDRLRMEAHLGAGEAKKRKHTGDANACSPVNAEVSGGNEAPDGHEGPVVARDKKRAKSVSWGGNQYESTVVGVLTDVRDVNCGKKARVEEGYIQSAAPVSTDVRLTAIRSGKHGLPRKPKPILKITTQDNLSGFRDENAQAPRASTDVDASSLRSRGASVDTGLLTPREVKYERPSL